MTARYTFTDEELDPANINPYGTGEYADRQNNITYTSEKPFILRSEAGVFALPSYDEANAQYILAASYFGSLTVTYIENNVIPVSTPDEFYSVVSMLSEAYANRRDVGFEPVIRLTKDIDLSTVEGERVIYGDLTIDLNGHTLDMSETDPYDVDAMIAGEIMCANGTLTLNDSSSAGTGKVNNVGGFRAFKDADGAAAAVPGGNIVVNGGTYALADGFTFDAEEGCSITLNAGTFSRWETAWNTYLGSADQEAVQTADGYTITPPALGIGTYKQYADKDGKHLIRYVFVKPISEIEGKSKATFTAKYNGRELTFPTNTYYTGLRYNGQQYQLTKGCVLFAVTIAGVPAGDENKLTCDIKLT